LPRPVAFPRRFPRRLPLRLPLAAALSCSAAPALADSFTLTDLGEERLQPRLRHQRRRAGRGLQQRRHGLPRLPLGQRYRPDQSRRPAGRRDVSRAQGINDAGRSWGTARSPAPAPAPSSGTAVPWPTPTPWSTPASA